MRRGKTLVLVLSSLALGTVVQAVTESSGGPYHGIVERNVFGLKPPPPPPDPTALAAQQAPKLTLTGITTFFGNKRALITIPAPKPGAPPESLMLAEGQGQDEVQVMEINEIAGTVKVNNHGTVQTLDFLNNGAKPIPGPAPAPMTIPPPMPAPQPGNVMSTPSPNSSITPLKSLPQRTLRLPGAANNSAAGPMGGMPGGVSAANNGSEDPLTAEQQAAMIYLNKKKYEAEGNPMAKIMPPIPGLEPEAPAAP